MFEQASVAGVLRSPTSTSQQARSPQGINTRCGMGPQQDADSECQQRRVARRSLKERRAGANTANCPARPPRAAGSSSRRAAAMNGNCKQLGRGASAHLRRMGWRGMVVRNETPASVEPPAGRLEA